MRIIVLVLQLGIDNQFANGISLINNNLKDKNN